MADLLVYLLLIAAWPPEGYTPAGGTSEVRVYRRAEKGVIELAAEGRIDAPPAQLRRVLLDYANHPRWNNALTESRILDRREGALDVYQRLDLPMLHDRDYTLHVTWGQEGETLWLDFVTRDEVGPPPVRGVVRVKVHEGHWELVPIDGGRATDARYRFRLNLAGMLPSWMARGRVSSDLPVFFDALKHQLPFYR